jgi:hypothetical protein
MVKSISADWIINQSKVPYVELHLDNVPYSEMLEEARALDDLYVAHRDNTSEGWASLSIHGISSQHTDHFGVYPEYAHFTNDTVPYTWTEIKDHCPITIKFLKEQFPYDVYHRVRFMRLSPYGYIKPHSDSNDMGLRAVNISLNNPIGCEFLYEKFGVLPFNNEGSIFMIANGYTHSVYNNSNEYRYHIIIHGYSTTKSTIFNNLIIDGYQSLMPSILNV